MAKLPTRISELPVVKLAYLANQLRAKKDVLAAEPIAVIGMACRFPGGDELPEAFWRFLRDGGDATREVPRERWNIDDIYDPTPGVRGKVYTRRGAFIENVDLFEPSFFGIPPRDAKDMDPQQRLLLEECWRALERSGIPPGGLVGSRTGVFVGLMHNDYNVLGITAGVEMQSASLNYPSMAAGRIAHTMGFQGPALTVDTACSSSAVAVHLACQSLRNDESDLALAGGVSLSLAPLTMMFECQNRMLSADGRCKAFDASADGFGRGEGCGVVVLRRLSDALAAGDQILAVIRGSALNHDGRSSGLMVPNGRSQERVLRMALENGGVEPHQVGFIEAHGTGTALGDPIEMEAIRAVYGRGVTRERPLFVGSVKTNIGHLEAAAGVAGLIKVILALRHESIPAHLHFATPNPNIRWDDLPVTIPTSAQPWPRGEARRIAGVSSFGFSGTNVHLLVEESPVLERPVPARERPLHVLSLSAKTEAALDALLATHVEELPSDDAALGDWCYTANVGRSQFEHRAAVTGATTAELRAALKRLRDEKAALPREPRRGIESPRPVFLFTGQGSLRAGVGRELHDLWPVFREALQRCSAVLAGLIVPRLEDILFGDEAARLQEDARCAQPALVALEFAVCELWASWGIVPSAVMGHSLGEYAAAVVAGVMSIEDALRLVVDRARLMSDAPGDGAMLAVTASEDVTTRVLAPFAEVVSIAAINGPEEVVVSGSRAAIADLAGALEREGVTCKLLRVTHAFHSPLMDPVVGPFEASVQGVSLSPPRLPFVSTLEGGLVTEALTRPGYWSRHLREPVRFAQGLERMRALKHGTYLEVGPAPVLAGLGRRLFAGEDALAWLPSLRPSAGEAAQLLSTLGGLYTRGFEIDWAGFDAPFERRPTNVPTYPFQRERYWLDVGPGRYVAESGGAKGESHPLAGVPMPLAGSRETRLSARLSASSPAFIAEHRVFGSTVLPAACYVEMALSAALPPTEREHPLQLQSFELERPLVFGDGSVCDVQTVLTPDDGGARFEIHGRDAEGQDWQRLARGLIGDLPSPGTRGALDARFLARFGAPSSAAPLYALMAKHGLEYGPSFQAIEELRFEPSGCLARIRLPDQHVLGMEAYRLHPLILDACFQTVAALFMEEAQRSTSHRQRMPVAIQRLRWFRRPTSAIWVHARNNGNADPSVEMLHIDLRLLGEDGEVIAEVDGLQLKRIDRQVVLSARPEAAREVLLEMAWKEQPAPRQGGPLPQGGRYVLVAEEGAVTDALRERLEGPSRRCILVTPGERSAQDSANRYVVDPRDPAGFDAVFRELAIQKEPTTVVWLWGLERRVERADASLADAAMAGALGALHLVQAMARANWARRPALWFVTRGAVAARPGDTVSGLAQSPVWGLGRAAALEHPELGCRLVDLDDSAEAPARLLTLLGAVLEENLLALRGEQLLAARLLRADRVGAKSEPPRLHADGAYLVTGGLGALGLETAAWLADAGARHLVLLGRGEPGEHAKERLAALAERGCEVTVARADASRHEDLLRVVAEVAARGLALRGVIHAAGVLDDGVLPHQDPARLARVLEPKVLGAWNLHRVTSELPLDFFVVYSSAASLVGVAGQANYVAANTFLDALAHHRRAQGLPALSVNWGRWAGAGMAERSRGRGQGSAEDASVLPPRRALEVLEALLARQSTQVGVLPFSATSMEAPPSPGHGRLFSALAAGTPARAARLTGLLEEFKRADAARRRGLLTHYVQDRLAPLLGFSPEHEVLQRRISLNEMGLDSLRAVELKNRMGRELGVDLPMSRFIDGTGIDGIVESLHAQLELSELLARTPIPATEVEELTL
ncbi:type I polyketide synthase [Corallococcus sp. M34]|uniref:type I polyketide synthase n=1 Tax=Citreicoccus inhibens TaxID=2849499 RepID=UPI001C24EBAC|nr:type I polyketide synthase [Citreicoccus inhibens]MBU8897894.1 type I polyketide synthase [Citreicoccus inhibens]